MKSATTLDPTTPRWYARTAARRWRCDPVPSDAVAFHRGLPGYAATALVDAPRLAAELGVAQVLVKDESSRFGLPAFKALGVTWAVHRALAGRVEHGPVPLVTATDGNHGRAVARAARTLGHQAVVIVPTGVHPAAVAAIRDEGAEVHEVDGDYDAAVAVAATTADQCGGLLVQDTAWPGYETVPGWIVEGYSTLLLEVDEQLRTLGIAAPDLIAVPVGVGSLAQAVVRHSRSRRDGASPAVLSVEPVVAAGVLASLLAADLVSVPTDATSMAGLCCGTPSMLAWPYLRDGLDAAVAVTDEESRAAADALASAGVSAGPCGAASLAGVRAALTGTGGDVRRSALGVDADSVVVLISTEGADANPAFADVTR